MMLKGLIGGVIGVIVGAVALLFAVPLVIPSLLSVNEESSDSQVVQSIKRQSEVVLLSLGIQGIAEESVARQVWGMEVPGSGRTLYLRYSYQAKLGIDGAQVEIEQTSDKSYTITVPEFQFLSHSDLEFSTAVEDDGVISMITPEIDVPTMVTKILDQSARQQHVADNRDLLEEQATDFYTGIIEGIDPDLELEFRFTQV